MTGIIVCNGSIENYSHYMRYFDTADVIIAADGGIKHLKKFGIKPDILLGDFDSASKDDLEHYKNTGIEICGFPTDKDMTDTELAVEKAIEKGCKIIFLFGAVGTRLDHSLSNVFLLRKMLDRGVKGYLVDEYNEITIINHKIELHREEGIKVTLLPLTQVVHGVTTRGLYYPLHNASIQMGSSWGVSNEFAQKTAEVEISEGLLLVIKSRD